MSEHPDLFDLNDSKTIGLFKDEIPEYGKDGISYEIVEKRAMMARLPKKNQYECKIYNRTCRLSKGVENDLDNRVNTIFSKKHTKDVSHKSSESNSSEEMIDKCYQPKRKKTKRFQRYQHKEYRINYLVMAKRSRNNRHKTMGKFTTNLIQYMPLSNPIKYEHTYDEAIGFITAKNIKEDRVVSVFDYPELCEYLGIQSV
ncbi:hypothetical protein RCL_jg19101.t1 [Rhizophagus clarus]|uniref:Uncharacterized protein n=1 Tax=Rhizophagus clarus TaxID=94130 RepID=A0A8H3QZF5_9GLOM|nr:hypothetical protein RCL_jg19101.t1 [Rhizophagus clarus]